MQVNSVASLSVNFSNKNNLSKKQTFGVCVAKQVENVLNSNLAKSRDGMYDIFRVHDKLKEIASWDKQNSILVLRNSSSKTSNPKSRLVDLCVIFKKGAVLTAASRVLYKNAVKLYTGIPTTDLMESFLSLTKEDYLKARTPVLKEFAHQSREHVGQKWFLKMAKGLLGNDSFKVFNAEFSKLMPQKQLKNK
ncbi:hypothetical protein J6Q66_02265 [bacterium]|nr:hypothetical protein [bacterium]